MQTLRKFYTRLFTDQSGSTQKIGRQAQLPVHPDFIAIDPSIRPLPLEAQAEAHVVSFPNAVARDKGKPEEATVAGHWAY